MEIPVVISLLFSPGEYYLTDAGIVSGRSFNELSEIPKIPSGDLKYFAYELSNDGPQLWIATHQGAIAISLRWFGTGKGISALSDKKWLKPVYQGLYPEILFETYPITAMATSINGDSLYAATKGAGVVRVFRNEVDGISGASSYAKWGPIEMPSDSVYSICIEKDGTQWIGTKGGVSVYDGTNWTSFTMDDGLISNNILFIMTDKNGGVYLCTDTGLMTYNFGRLTCYQ